MNKIKDKTYSLDPEGRIIMKCPRCGEELTSLDVENYPSCPFCGKMFAVDRDLEFFILDPIVRAWVDRVSDGN